MFSKQFHVNELKYRFLPLSYVFSSRQAVKEYGMGPKGSALICGYTTYHRLLESSLAQLKKKEVKKRP